MEGDSSTINIHQLMNIVPLIQEKWSLVGTRLKLSSDKLDDIWQAAREQQIPVESTDTFCCVKMLTSWYDTSNDVSFDVFIMAIDAPHVGLRAKISSVKAALSAEYVTVDSDAERSVTNLPKILDQPYLDMKTKFCLTLHKSLHSISDILVYLRVYKISPHVLEGIYDFPELLESFERNKLLSKSDLSLLKNIAHFVHYTKVTEVIEKYESLLIADKVLWYNSYSTGTYLVGRTDKKPEDVTIKDSSNAKSAVSKIVNIKETDSVLDYSQVGSVTFYWRLIYEGVPIKIIEVPNASLIKYCKSINLTHVGIMTNGHLIWASIDEIGNVCILVSHAYFHT